LLRADTAGSLQALVGLWQIFVRQRTLPAAQADAVFSSIVSQFDEIKSNRDLFDASRSGLKAVLAATGSKNETQPQGRLVDLLAGAAEPTDTESHTQIVQDMVRILEAQRIVSLDVIFALADHLEGVARGEKLNPQLVNR